MPTPATLHPGTKRSQEGSAMLMAVFVLALLSLLGLGLLFVTQTQVQAAQTSLRVKQAFYLAEAAQEDGRQTLFNVNRSGPFTDDLVNHAGANGVFDFDPGTLVVNRDAAGNVISLAGYGDDVPLRGLTAFGGGWYAAFMTNDAGAGEDPTQPADGNDRVLITGIGAGPDQSLEIVQAIVERWEVLPLLPPATITLLGPPPSFWGGTSDSHGFTGDDCGGAGVPGLYVPVVGVIGSDAEAAAEAGIYRDEDGDGPDYDSGPYSDAATFADLTDASEPTVVGSGYDAVDPSDSLWTDCPALHKMVEDLRAIADVVCCNPPVCATAVPATCELPDPPDRSKLIFVDGDLDVGPSGGMGTLVVTGTLTIDGRADWNGMIFAFGAGVYERNGGGNGVISGAVMVADIAGPDNVYGNDDDCSGDDGGFGTASYLHNGGGNSGTSYCSTDILGSRPVAPYDIVGFRQR